MAMGRSSKSRFTRVTDFFYERMRHKDAWSAAQAEPTGLGRLSYGEITDEGIRDITAVELIHEAAKQRHVLSVGL
jgi:hypothetical protein